MDPALIRLQEMINSGKLQTSHPFYQEIHCFSIMYGNISNDPIRGIGDIRQRYPALMYLQERMRQAPTGKAAYNFYLGKHNVSSGQRYFQNSSAILPPIGNVFHFGLSPSSWRKKQVFPAVFDGVILQLLLAALDVIPKVSQVCNKTRMSETTYTSVIFDQKGISPGADIFDSTIHGIVPPLHIHDVEDICEEGYSSMLKILIERFASKQYKWVKQIEVYMIQLLDKSIAIPIAVYGISETGDHIDIKERIDEVLLYANSCQKCLQDAVRNNVPPSCSSSCIDCFRGKELCGIHEELFDTWNSDARPCLNCARSNSKCKRFKVMITVSDMDPSYSRFGKDVSGSFDDYIEGKTQGINHLHDVCHNIKNAEASLERGSHFDGQCVYDSNDLAIVLSTVGNESYEKLNGGITHKAILQYDKQSDELSLQRLSKNVTDVLSEVKSLIKTDVPESRRPWFADGHNRLNKPLYITVSLNGIVFATDDYSQQVFYYRQNPLPKKVLFFGKKENTDSNEDPCLHNSTDSAGVTWKYIGGITFFREEKCVLVCDFGFRTIRVLQGSKASRTREQQSFQPIRNLSRLPNIKIVAHALKISNKPSIFPCGIAELNKESVAVLDPVNKSVEIVEVDEQLMSMISLKSIASEIGSPLDCVCLKPDYIAFTTVSNLTRNLNILCISRQEVEYTSEFHINASGVCMLDNDVIISDQSHHCLYLFNYEEKSIDLFAGVPGEKGFEDGPLSTAKLNSPFGVACRGRTIYVTEHPAEYQGGVRVISDLDGLIKFKSAWRNIARCFGFISKRESSYLEQNYGKGAIPKGKKLNELATSLPTHTSELKSIITDIRKCSSANSLDITQGSMSSHTAEAVYEIMINGIDFLVKYFDHIEKSSLSSKISSKSLTTRMIECFFGHLTVSGTQANNLKCLEMRRRITNEAFTYLIPYFTSLDNNVSIRSEKERVGETYSYNQEDISISDSDLLWELENIKTTKLLTVETKAKIVSENLEPNSERKPTEFAFGRSESCDDYIDLIHPSKPTPEQNANLAAVKNALKSRPMRRLRGFSKRRFGTTPTILGVHAERIQLPEVDGTIEQIENASNESNKNNESENLIADNVFRAGEVVVFRGTDGLVFNLLKLTKSYCVDDLHARSKVFGNFLVEIDSEINEDALFFQDPQWISGSMLFRDILRDDEGNIITVSMNISVVDDGTYFHLNKRDYESICKVSKETEARLQYRNSRVEEAEESQSSEESEDEFNGEQQPINLTRRQRRTRGNRYADVISTFL